MTIQEQLFSLRDEKYAAFSAKLIPTVSPDRFIGVRSPQLRTLAKELYKSDLHTNALTYSHILGDLPHRYHEENMLHAYLLCEEKNTPLSLRKQKASFPTSTIGRYATPFRHEPLRAIKLNCCRSSKSGSPRSTNTPSVLASVCSCDTS